jgi:hypothetical protein
MPEKPEQTTIEEIARQLALRRQISFPTVLFLGSRAGGLFRSQALAETVRDFPGLPPAQDQFATAYHFFERLGSGEEELRSLLRDFLRAVAVSNADLSVAQLIKQNLFHTVVSTNIDSLLERALDKVGIQRIFEFEVVIPERDRERGFNVGPADRQLYCRIIKSFGDLSVRSSYQIGGHKRDLESGEALREWLEFTLKGDVLVVGFDVLWDQEIARAFLPSTNPLWFIHEEVLLDHQLIRTMFDGRPVKYIAGPEGSYDAFFRAICQRLIPNAVSAPQSKELVNRNAELQVIDEAFTTLTDPDNVLKTPVLAFHGIGGIGKTAIVQHVARRCENEHLPYIHVEAEDIPGLARAIQQQVNKYHDVDSLLQNDDNSLERSKIATRELLKQGAAVMLVDSLNTTEQMKWLGDLLKDIHRGNRLFVVLAGKRKFAFEPDRPFIRQLKFRSYELAPLDRESSREYLSQLEEDVREIVYEWTRGYPLAMQVMKEAIARGLDINQAQDRLSILATLIERVIVQKVLARVDGEQRSWYQSMLGLLSFPRRFYIETMRSLIERFAPELQPASQLAYLLVPRKISEETEVLDWNSIQTGFSVSSPVRNLFLLDFRVRQPEKYRDIHAFLARLNYAQIQSEHVRDVDLPRWLKEYIYHLACLGNAATLIEQISHAILPVIQKAPQTLINFYEEFTQDADLQEALGSSKDEVLFLIHKVQAFIHQQFADATTGTDRIEFLRFFFIHLRQMREAYMLPHALRERISLAVQLPVSEGLFELYQELLAQKLFSALFNFGVQGADEQGDTPSHLSVAQDSAVQDTPEDPGTPGDAGQTPQEPSSEG